MNEIEYGGLSRDSQIYVLKLEGENNLLKEQYQGLKSKTDIMKRLRYEQNTQEPNNNKLHEFEEGMISALLWVLGLPDDTKLNELEVKDV